MLSPLANISARLKVSEIFFSLQGEASRIGLPTVFVRLTGCPLRCAWCDTAYAFTGGESLALPDILEQVKAFSIQRVCVTGGEPLAQKGCFQLLSLLCGQGYDVSLETSGAFDIEKVDARVSRILDIKTPSSGEAARNLWKNLDYLRPHDEIKIVIADREDYDWAKARIVEYRLPERCPVLFSPVYGAVLPQDLAKWMLEDKLNVRFQMQLHKMLWGDAQGK